MEWLALLILVVWIAAILVIYANADSHQREAKKLPQAHEVMPIARPARPPFSAPTWSERGNWSIPFRVRYAIAFVRNGQEGPMSAWGPWLSSSEHSNPILSRFPVDPTRSATGVLLYRQFEGQPARLLEHLQYPFYGRYTDRHSDTH